MEVLSCCFCKGTVCVWEEHGVYTAPRERAGWGTSECSSKKQELGTLVA